MTNKYKKKNMKKFDQKLPGEQYFKKLWENLNSD
jgi:hypothetical protein